ncbi:hypothetical protein FLJC2902T_05700 [Flavobacterium limnosediminis JC2902]|uniref:Lipoprotein n=1 Tax=Flavobacterium limnosediminis JC2902 TaxID=1341181 RepID=V6STW2_9FLAO|nr:hypothetical protein [Flavobacterium limnosediminis]ESU30076.1 hypothetical protein FLJC2902T_05700 [Flavobacterium limnosediminis JC2902]
MKLFTLLTSVVITLTSCNCQKKAAEKNELAAKATAQEKVLPTLEYEANTRGFYRKITISDKKAWVIPVRDGKAVEVPVSDSDWKELVSLYQSVNKEGLKDLKAPTEKRFYDGAPMANFRVITKETTFESATFDGGFPPAEIEKIVNIIIAIGGKIE